MRRRYGKYISKSVIPKGRRAFRLGSRSSGELPFQFDRRDIMPRSILSSPAIRLTSMPLRSVSCRLVFINLRRGHVGPPGILVPKYRKYMFEACEQAVPLPGLCLAALYLLYVTNSYSPWSPVSSSPVSPMGPVVPTGRSISVTAH